MKLSYIKDEAKICNIHTNDIIILLNLLVKLCVCVEWKHWDYNIKYTVQIVEAAEEKKIQEATKTRGETRAIDMAIGTEWMEYVIWKE